MPVPAPRRPWVSQQCRKGLGCADLPNWDFHCTPHVPLPLHLCQAAVFAWKAPLHFLYSPARELPLSELAQFAPHLVTQTPLDAPLTTCAGPFRKHHAVSYLSLDVSIQLKDCVGLKAQKTAFLCLYLQHLAQLLSYRIF